MAVTRLRARQVTSEHTHDFVEFFLVEQGEGWHRWNQRELPLATGSLTFVSAEDVHSYRSATQHRLQFINLAVARDWWASFQRLLPAGLSLPAAAAGDPPGHVRLDPAAARTCGERLHDLLEHGAGEPTLLASVVATLTGHLLQPERQVSLAPAGAPQWLDKLLREFQDPELVTRPIAFWQKRAGVSAEHLARTCRRYLGEPPTVLLNRARIELIATRLREGEDKVAGLAYDAGFQNLGYFYRTFRRFKGCTPREWQASHVAGVAGPK